MKILYFHQYFTTPRGAWSTRAYEFARRWVEAGHEVTVVTGVYDKSDLEPAGLVARREIDGIDVRIVGVRLSNKHGLARRLVSFTLYAKVASWLALVHPADVVVCSSGPITVGLPGLVARWLRHRPLLFEVRDLWPEGAIQLGILENRLAVALARRFEALCYRSAERIVALSPGQADDIRRRFHGTRVGTPVGTPVAVVPNASDNDLAERARSEEAGGEAALPAWARGKRLAVYAGTLGLIDDCGQLVDLAAELARRGRDDLAVVVIGDGAERQVLESRAGEQGLGVIHFLGLLPRLEVFRWLVRARLALFTVKEVPFLATASPNKLFDAFACGAPVVQTTDGWIADLLAAEGCGLNLPAGDSAAMADAVVRLADDDALHAELSANARRLARERFDRDRLAAAMLAEIERAAEGVEGAAAR